MAELLELQIHDLSRSGPGVARDSQGRIIFVPFTAPGDRVRVEIVEEAKRYAEARLVELLEPSPQRATPPCPEFSRCGGCEWQHVPYDLQWRTKLSGIQHALDRVGVKNPGPLDEIPATQIWNYRNRMQFRGEGNTFGLLERRSKRVVNLEKCWIAREEINAELPRLRAEGAKRDREFKVEVEVLPDGSVKEWWNRGHAAGGFRQIHDEQNLRLQNWVAENLDSGGELLDLYGGSGNLSLGIASRFSRVDCVDVGVPRERPPEAPAHYHYHRSPVGPWIQRSQGGPVQVILDPPREGMGSDWFRIVEALKKRQATRLLAVGCDASAWAGDVQRLHRHGWRLVKAGAIDLFPQTHHIEALAVLQRDA